MYQKYWPNKILHHVLQHQKFSIFKSNYFWNFLGTFVYFLFFCKFTKKSSKLIHINISLSTCIKNIGQTKFCIMYCSIKNFQYSNPIISGIFWEPLYIFYFSVNLQKSLQN